MLSDWLITSDAMIQNEPTQNRVIYKVLNNVEYIQKLELNFMST